MNHPAAIPRPLESPMVNLLSRARVLAAALIFVTAACENRRGNGFGVPDDASLATFDTSTTQPDTGMERPDRATNPDVVAVVEDVQTAATDTNTTSPPDAGEPVIDVVVVPPIDVQVAPAMDATTSTDARALPQRDASIIPTSWSDCSQAAVFGMDGEPCTFSGTCVECSIGISPRTAACVSGGLRVAGANPSACGGGPRDAGVTRPDAGRDAGVCGPLFIETPAPAQCTQTESDCLWNGNTVSACAASPSTCRTCFTAQIFSCATDNGCADELGARACCIAANCPDGSCVTTTCAAQEDAFFACARATQESETCVPTSHCLRPQTVDAGVRRDAAVCGPSLWPHETEPGCTAATSACIDDATTGTEVGACLDSDTTGTPAELPGNLCRGCLGGEAFACATDNGCADDLGLVDCCAAAACPAGSAPGCAGTSIQAGGACRTQWLDFVACSDAVPGSACPFPSVCFAD